MTSLRLGVPWRFRALVVLVALSPFLAACGFEPLYAEHKRAVLEPELAAIKIYPIREHIGQLLEWKLRTELNPSNAAVPHRYALQISLSFKQSYLAVDPQAVATRGNVAAVADCTLTTIDGKTVLFRGQIQSTGDYNMVNDAYAAQIGEGNAEKRVIDDIGEEIELRLALVMRQRAARQ